MTTIGNMTFGAEGQSLQQALARDLAAAAATAAVDYVLHPVMSAPSPEALAELPVLAAQGHMTLKLFMISEEFEAHAAEMITAIAAAGQLGMLTLLHCEDAALVRFAGQQLLSSRPRRAGQLGGEPAGAGRAGRGRPGGRDLRGDRIAGVHRAPVIRGRA